DAAADEDAGVARVLAAPAVGAHRIRPRGDGVRAARCVLTRAACTVGDSGSGAGYTRWQGALVHGLVRTRVAQLFDRPALLQHAHEMRLDRALVPIFESGKQLEDGLPRAFDEAARLAMRHRAIAADQVERELDDHANTTEPSAIEECGGDLRLRLVFELWHR